MTTDADWGFQYIPRLDPAVRRAEAQPVAYRLGKHGMWAYGNLVDEGALTIRLLWSSGPRRLCYRWDEVGFLLRNGQEIIVKRKVK